MAHMASETQSMAYKPEVLTEMTDKRMHVQGLANNGPKNRTDVQARHPVERLLLDDVKRAEKQEMMAKAITFGQHAPFRTKMERNLLAQFQRLPGLESSLLGLHTVMDLDDTIEFEDIFNLEANAAVSSVVGPNRGLHDVMEQRLNMRF
mmetsp:Transcript_34956/g.52604  ORF Transcript_34956/g.52604 Transcript_34956/m.52604 type:complete len:149 (-) Transcript_34956:186-632(-)